jgi:dephospho-CoA kinase
MQGLEEARAQGAERIVLDVPLLLENDAEHGLARMCDALVFVDTPAEERERRAIAHRAWPPGEVARRETAQLSMAEKRRRADCVIPNQGSLDALASEVHRALRELGLETTP